MNDSHFEVIVQTNHSITIMYSSGKLSKFILARYTELRSLMRI